MSDVVKAITQDTPNTPLPEGYPERIPDFATEEEAREFWDTHDTSYYWDQTEDVTHNPPPELRRGPGRAGSRAPKRAGGKSVSTVSVRLHDDTIAAITRMAASRHVPEQALMASWIVRGLTEEQDREQDAGS